MNRSIYRYRKHSLILTHPKTKYIEYCLSPKSYLVCFHIR